jgi:hypothetical protein
MGTVIQYVQRGNEDRHQRWDRIERADLFARYGDLQAQDLSQRQAAKVLDVPRSTLQAWQAYRERLDESPGYLSLRNHQLRGLGHPRKRECLTAVHNFFFTRPDGTTAAERFFGQKPRSMFAAILGPVNIPPAPLSPPQRAAG